LIFSFHHTSHTEIYTLSLHDALPILFPPLYQAMIRTGELTGKLDECCFELARQQKAQRQLTEKVKSALRYPIIILAMAIMVVVADRKSTRLNSSHVSISYAVFCLKKK